MRVALSFSAMAGALMIGSGTYAQSLLASRMLGSGSPQTAVTDTRAWDVNPAGIVRLRDWDLTVSSYLPAGTGAQGAVFSGIAAGKQFLGGHAVAAQYTPGLSLEFRLPTTVILGGTTPVSVEERIEYHERFAAGYALDIAPGFSAGLAARWRSTLATDTRFTLRQIDSTSLIVPDQRTYETSSLLGDAGILWQPIAPVLVGVVGRDLLTIRTEALPAELAPYALAAHAAAEIGVSWEALPGARLEGSFGTGKTGALGATVALWRPTTFRIATLLQSDAGPVVAGLGAGFGLTLGFVGIDAGYVRFFDRGLREGSVTLSQFDLSRIRGIDLNPYATDRLALSLRAVVGPVRDRVVSIRGVEIAETVYPSSATRFATEPIGWVTVRNTAPHPVQVRTGFFLEPYMDAPTAAAPVSLPPGEEARIPLTAVFNDRLRDNRMLSIREATVTAGADPEDPDDRYQARLAVAGRNDWDGGAASLRAFVTPNDPVVLRTAREILREWSDSVEAGPAGLMTLRKIRFLLNAFAGRLLYVGDPKQTADYVQYPPETLDLRGGDCDDMTVCFSALLNSIGISTAFVDVVPPGRPQDAHIYLLVDTAVDPRFGERVSTNAKRFVVRKGSDGSERIWIPIETTVIRNGFDDAWSAGAQRYFDDVEIGLGLVKGWVRIVDVHYGTGMP